MHLFKNALAWTILAFTSVALAEDAYYFLPVQALKLTEGTFPPRDAKRIRWDSWEFERTYAVTDGGGEAYIAHGPNASWDPIGAPAQEQIAIRAPQGKDVSGRLFVANPNTNGMIPLKFKISPTEAKADGRSEFLRVKEEHYRALLDRNIPGAAWFRHQQAEAAKARGHTAPAPRPDMPRFNRRDALDAENTFDLFSGGRAISENLQLDRLVRAGQKQQSTVDINTITGITVQEMDWKPLIKDLKPELDPLAAYIPSDQHAILFASFAAMTDLIDQADADGTPLLQIFEPRSEDATSRTRYQKQLCLELSEVSRLLGPQVIGSVAATGSDPYLRTGSDIGILFQTKSPGLLRTFIAARQTSAKQSNATVKAVSGELAGVSYTGVVSPDRLVSSYVAALDDVVFVSNSLYQLGCLIDVAKKNKPSLATQDEYLFFRNRYPRTDKGESAFIVLTDATIRRWCGPRWRIGNSRRTQAAAALAEAQAAHLDDIVKGAVQVGKVGNDLIDGDVQLNQHCVLSQTYGSLDFLTPICELPLSKVSQSEADAYKAWRDGYQQNWRQYFDPIAVRVSLASRQIRAEVSVMPLIARTDYRDFMEITRNARISPGAGDPHPEALAHLIMAINAQSQVFRQAGGLFSHGNSPLNTNPLGWLGQSIAVYADQDPFWERLRKVESSEQFLEKNYAQLPVALHCEVKNALGLAAFLTMLRSYADETAPKMTAWQTLEYKGQPYVKVTPSTATDNETLDKLTVYYAATPKSFLLTLSEPLLKRALDRQAARDKSKPDTNSFWLGDNLSLQLNHNFIEAFEIFSRQSYQTAQQKLCWANLPILNEWKRLYPSQDPVKLHEQLWQTKLTCPGGGAYVWNEQWQTMESTVYGHPGKPKPGPSHIDQLANIRAINFGLTFENQGLSAKVIVDRQSTPPQLARKAP